MLATQLAWSGCHLHTPYENDREIPVEEVVFDAGPDAVPDADDAVTCVDLCGNPHESRCNGSRIVTCVTSTSGCLDWVAEEDCAAAGMVCMASSVGPRCIMRCDDECAEETSRCNGSVIESCMSDEEGCLHWSPDRDCAAEGLRCNVLDGSALCAEGCPERVLEGTWNVMVLDAGDLAELSGYTRIVGNLVIEGTRLPNLSGLECLDTVEARLVILDNVALTSLRGLNSLESVGTLYIQNNPELTSLDGLSALTTIEVGGFRITDNVQLPTCEAEALLERLGDPDWISEPEISGNDDDATCD